jgi:HPt (histidine-containing phosphotransfer) domain-containing protein
MNAYYDPTRVKQLQEVMGSEPEAVIASMLKSMTTGIDRVETAVASGELDQATRAAHACRNDALMIGATQLLEALTALEVATRDCHEARTRAALERVKQVWPPTRDELAAVAGSTGSTGSTGSR